MNQLRMARLSLLFVVIGCTTVVATFFVPAILAIFSVLATTTLILSLLGIRTRAGRIGLLSALVLLPSLSFLAYEFGFDTQTFKKPTPTPRSTEIYFSPGGGCTDAIISQIASAKRSVHVQAYIFTSTPIAKALVEAHERGVLINVILDKSQDTKNFGVAKYLYDHHIVAWIDKKHAIAHNKIMIIDEATVITGSFNFTKAAEISNAENVVVLHDSSLAAIYKANWDVHVSHSSEYLPPNP